jgi:hypothetical protein
MKRAKQRLKARDYCSNKILYHANWDREEVMTAGGAGGDISKTLIYENYVNQYIVIHAELMK